MDNNNLKQEVQNETNLKQSTMQRVRQYDGYRGKPIFTPLGNNSVYYNYEHDKQCKVPIRNLEQVLKEFGLDEENENT